ncbi:MAG: protein kinase [Calothrix sp. MO_192.B10]|nr:protein kinase [Calothrix sp. MO_192.B10]
MEPNKLEFIEQNIAELHHRLPQDIAVINGLAQALEKIETLFPEHQKIPEYITKFKNDLEDKFSELRREFDEDHDKLLEESQTILSQLDEIESNLASKINDFKHQQQETETELRNELSILKSQLNNYGQTHKNLHDQVSELQSEIKYLQQYNVQLTAKINQILGKCTHEGNSPQDLFCKDCGEPINILQQIRQYQVLKILTKEAGINSYVACKKNHDTHKYQRLSLQKMKIDITQINQWETEFLQMGNTFKNLVNRGIPKLIDFFVEGEYKYLVMERLFGQNLAEYIEQKRTISSQQGIQWMIEVCEVLDYLHNQQPAIIHGDIQPANLLVQNLNNHIVLQNFRTINQIGMPVNTFLHSGIYAAPEQKYGPLLIQSDIYGIGVTLIFILTGKSPEKFYHQGHGSNQFHLEATDNITKNLQTIILKATQPNPDNRYSTAKELAQELKSRY